MTLTAHPTMTGRFAAQLEARDPARNLQRAYALEAGVDLFGAWLLRLLRL